MKTKIILIGLVMALALPAFAQRDATRSNKNEFSIGYGFFPASSFRPWRWLPYGGDMDCLGAFYATYTRRLTRTVGVGATYCFDPRQITYYDSGFHYGNGYPICRLGESSHTLMVHLKTNWLNTEHVVLYSKLAIGASLWGYRLDTDITEGSIYENPYYEYEIILPDNHCCFAYQFTPIGIEVGDKRWAGFAQIGIGMEGCFSIGVRYGLKDKEQ